MANQWFTYTNRCGKCPQCLRVETARRTGLAALTVPGNGDDVRLVWNRVLEENPCSDPPATTSNTVGPSVLEVLRNTLAAIEHSGFPAGGDVYDDLAIVVRMAQRSEFGKQEVK